MTATSQSSEPVPATGPRRWRLPLAVKIGVALVGLVVMVLLVNGAVNVWLSYGQGTRAALEIQQEKAQAAAERVSQFVTEIENQIGWTTRVEWSRIPPEQQRYDFIRLLRQVPAITELSYIDGTGKERLRVSRLEPDAIDSGRDYTADPRFAQAVANKTWYGPVYLRRGSEPYMTIAIAHAGRNPGVTVAEVNLKLIWDVITAIHVGQGGYAYVVDNTGRLIAHPDLSLVLRDTDLSNLPQVQQAIAERQAGGAPSAASKAEIANAIEGGSVLTSYAAVPRLNWIVFVQLPIGEAMAPVRTSLMQTLALLGLGLLLALIAGGLLARRLVVPIRKLQQGAERLGGGDLSQRIDIRTGDEIETLADRFNRMAGRVQESYETLEAKVEARTRDLNEALIHQTSAGEILRVIASSPTDVGPVLRAVAENAAELCQASDVAVLLRKGDDLYFSAHRGPIPIGMEKWPVNRRWTAGRAVVDRAVIHVEDLNGPDGEDFPDGRELSRRMGHRAILSVPMLRDGESIGAIVVRRTEPKRFSDKQIALLRTFADQAVIAIDNVRLFEEAQTRTRELAASLAELRTAQDRLIQSEKMASLGQLTAGIAHEIKNPLNFVNNFSSLSVDLLKELKEVLEGLAETATPDQKADIDDLIITLEGNLEKIGSHGRRADGIVKSMLMHSRGVSDDVRPVEVNAIVEEALNLSYHGLRAQDKSFNVTLERDYDDQAGSIEAVQQDLSRVLINIIGNGFYAANKRRRSDDDAAFVPTLRVATRATNDGVEIRIRDNGVGIPEEAKSKLFTPFFTTKPTGEGTGLGLSISFEIIARQHGGSITVDSQVNEFTEFTIRLPRRQASKSTVQQKEARG